MMAKRRASMRDRTGPIDDSPGRRLSAASVSATIARIATGRRAPRSKGLLTGVDEEKGGVELAVRSRGYADSDLIEIRIKLEDKVLRVFARRSQAYASNTGIFLTWMVGTALVLLGLAFTVWARVHLGRNWSGIVTVKQGHELIRSGPYRWVRHPIYTGLLLAFMGSAIALGQWRGVLAMLIVFAALWRKLRLEERWMIETFGAAYTAYRNEVAALIPFVL